MFSKYEMDMTVESVYCYPGTHVLKNKLGIRDVAVLKAAEEEITAVKQYDLLQNPIPGRFTKTHLLRIHKALFEDIYPFAGKLRTEQIGKASTWFYPPNLIEWELKRVFALIHEQRCFRACPKTALTERFAYVMAELNIIHPFREGNGRLFVSLFACWQARIMLP